MEKNVDLKNIKDKYGEKMMHLCRSQFPTILEHEGALFQILSKNFAYSKYLYDDIMNNCYLDNFIYFVMSEYDIQYDVGNSCDGPEELLAKVGYKLYECKTRFDIDKFRRYYKPSELLCTFNTDRLSTHYVFFVVKDNADDIKREDFPYPDRDDEYSTSVMSIQFYRGTFNHVSIKSRYNHTVKNPDCTFNNNLDNIVPGLTRAFEKKYHLYALGYYGDDNHGFKLPGYIRARDGRFYRYNYRINDIWYCPDNVILYNGYLATEYLQKEKYLVADYFIFDLVNKRVMLYDEEIEDAFPDTFKDITKMEVINDKESGCKCVLITQPENIIKMYLNKYNQIIAYNDEYGLEIGDNFMLHNETLREISLPSVRKIGTHFLFFNKRLELLDAPNLRSIGACALLLDDSLKYVNVPNLKQSSKSKIRYLKTNKEGRYKYVK